MVHHARKLGKEPKAGIWRQELIWRHKNAASWLVPLSLLNLLFYTIQDLLAQGGTTHPELGPPTSTINQENALQRRYLNCSSFFSHNSTLCKLRKKLIRPWMYHIAEQQQPQETAHVKKYKSTARNGWLLLGQEERWS